MKLLKPRSLDVAFVVASAALAAGTVLSSCSGAQAGKLLHLTFDQCLNLAKTYSAPDVERACQAGHDISPLLEALLAQRAALQAPTSDAGAPGDAARD
jgi:hypothetical protein